MADTTQRERSLNQIRASARTVVAHNEKLIAKLDELGWKSPAHPVVMLFARRVERFSNLLSVAADSWDAATPPFVVMEKLRAQIQSIGAGLQNCAKQPNQHTHATNAEKQLDEAIALLPQAFPLGILALPTEGLAAEVQQLQTKFSKTRTGFEAQLAAAKEGVATVSRELASLESKRDEWRLKVAAEFAADDQDFKELVERWNQRSEHTLHRAQSLWQTQLAEQLEDDRAMLKSRLLQVEQAQARLQEDLAKSGAEFVQDMESQLSQLKDMMAEATGKLLGKDFAQQGRRAEWAVFGWNAASIIAFLAVAGGGWFAAKGVVDQTEMSAMIVARLLSVGVLLVVAGFFAKRAGDAREWARYLHRNRLQLDALGPFLKSLDASERAAIRRDLVPMYFDPNSKSVDSTKTIEHAAKIVEAAAKPITKALDAAGKG